MARPLPPDFQPQYHQLHRVGRSGVWRSIVGVVLLLVLVFGVVPLVAGGVAFAVLLLAGNSTEEAGAVLDVTAEATPAGLALLNVIIAAAIPLTFLVTWWLHRLKPRWVSSVAPRLRWGYLLACVGLSVVALLASLGVALLLPLQAGDAPVGEVNDFTTQTRDFIIVILLLTPLQAAGEEYAFRGYLHQAIGALTKRAWIALVLTSLLFAMAHGLQNFPLFFDRFMFGLIAGWLVIRTGGLEAGIALHVLNNLLAFGAGILFGDVAEMVQVSEISWWNIPVTLTQSGVYVVLVLLVARRMKVQRLTAPPAPETGPDTGPAGGPATSAEAAPVAMSGPVEADPGDTAPAAPRDS